MDVKDQERSQSNPRPLVDIKEEGKERIPGSEMKCAIYKALE